MLAPFPWRIVGDGYKHTVFEIGAGTSGLRCSYRQGEGANSRDKAMVEVGEEGGELLTSRVLKLG